MQSPICLWLASVLDAFINVLIVCRIWRQTNKEDGMNRRRGFFVVFRLSYNTSRDNYNSDSMFIQRSASEFSDR